MYYQHADAFTVDEFDDTDISLDADSNDDFESLLIALILWSGPGPAAFGSFVLALIMPNLRNSICYASRESWGEHLQADSPKFSMSISI